MKNILLKSLYHITNQKEYLYPNGSMLDEGSYDYYRKMQDLSIESARKNLQGDWHLLELDGEFESLQDSFVYTFYKTRELWLENAPCNILYTDPDMLFQKPFECFNNKFQLGFHLFGENNCGARYFSHYMSEDVWEFMLNRAKNWDYPRYDYEQDMYMDAAQYCVDCSPESIKKINESPDWRQAVRQQPCVFAHDYEILEDPQELSQFIQNVDVTFEENVVHYHSSRYPKVVYMIMEKAWNQARKNQ